MIARKVVVLGLDAADFGFLDPWRKAGDLPVIDGLLRAGAHGTLRSTDPPVSSPAWATFMTGLNPGAHGLSEVLYAFSSAGNNNGSAFAGLTANEPFYNTALGLAMLIARYWLIIPVLAIAGSLARKKVTPPSAGTLPTHTPVFVVMLVGIVLLVGALNFVPVLALGPIVEHLQMIGG